MKKAGQKAATNALNTAARSGKNSTGLGIKPSVQGKAVEPVKTTRKKVVKSEQPWKVRESQEYKKKIYGKAQKSTPGHDTRSYREAIKAAKRKDTKSVHLNQGMNKVTGAKKGDAHYMKPNRRPDVTIKKRDGKIDQIEVPSAGDKPKNLLKRMENTNSKLPENMQGKFKTKDITKKK